MGNRNRLCLSSIHSDSQMPKEGNPREGNYNSSMPSLAHSAMVCTTPPTGGGHPHPPSHNPRALNRPSGKRAPTGEQQNPLTCRLDGIRRDLLTKGLSGQATGIVLATQRTSTQNQYKSCWSKWVGWCNKQQVDPIHPSIVKVVDDSYVERSKAWSGLGNRPQPLFLNFQASHKPVSSAITGRWIKDITKEAGIDV